MQSDLLIGRAFLNSFEKWLSHWFDMNFKDIYDVLRLMGLDDETYTIQAGKSTPHFYTLEIYSPKQKYTLKISIGDMVNPYPSWELSDSNSTTYFYVKKEIHIQKTLKVNSYGEIVEIYDS